MTKQIINTHSSQCVGGAQGFQQHLDGKHRGTLSFVSSGSARSLKGPNRTALITYINKQLAQEYMCYCNERLVSQQWTLLGQTASYLMLLVKPDPLTLGVFFPFSSFVFGLCVCLGGVRRPWELG